MGVDTNALKHELENEKQIRYLTNALFLTCGMSWNPNCLEGRLILVIVTIVGQL